MPPSLDLHRSWSRHEKPQPKEVLMSTHLRVLVSGASVGGPTVAYWLSRIGCDVTVVEKAAEVRGGGYPIDIRGAAVEVVTRMGLIQALRAAHIGTRRASAEDLSGKRIASVETGKARRVDSADIELPRGELTALLYEASQHHARYVFDDSIEVLSQTKGEVGVTFRSGRSETYDLVIGADGLHSNTRRLAFGPVEQFHRYLGHCFAGFSVPNHLGLEREVVLINTPGRMAALYAAGRRPDLHALLAFRRPMPTRSELADPDFQQRATYNAFSDATGTTAWLLDQLATANDLFFDTLSQIVMPSWSSGRVTLIGDAACAPSFLSGEGTSLALVGGYVLAAELASAGGDHGRAVRAYEARLRDYVRRNQSLAFTSRRLMIPANRRELQARNALLRMAPLLARLGLVDRPVARAATAVTLPEFPALR